MNIITALIILILINSCTSLPDEQVNQPPIDYSQYDIEKKLLGKTHYNLGLALSGGGLRSALYSYGALKALYDARILKEVDIISSVSGGGYTAYSLFTSEQNSNFGSFQFSNDNIYKNTCDLIVKGNFVTTSQILWAAISFHPKKNAINLYQASLSRTFAGKKFENESFQINKLLPDMQKNNLPFWIINTTIQSPEPSGWSDALFEFTPMWMGNDSYGYKIWDDSSIHLRKTIAISGAAFAPLLQQNMAVSLPNFKGKLTQSDGGHSENLGAISLIKRGVKKIIIIDAEHDPDYKFGAYFNLKNRLAAFGTTLTIQSIDNLVKSKDRPESAIYKGETGDGKSTIYYVKMSIPKSIDKIINDKESIKNGLKSYNNYFNLLNENKAKNGDWDCDFVKDLNFSLDDFYAYKIASYSNYLNNDNYLRNFDKLTKGFFYSKFPQYTTVDQSFFLDQSIAFMGLGYHSTKELINIIKLSN